MLDRAPHYPTAFTKEQTNRNYHSIFFMSYGKKRKENVLYENIF